MKIKLSFILFFAFLFCSSQDIADRVKFEKCRKEFSKKICLSDEDKDSVFFYLDECPKIFGVAENNGCAWTDTDNDGVLDKDDACREIAGPKENHGCPWPDTDGDGILDKDDKCPTVAGIIENKGCPPPFEYSQEELHKIKNEILEKIKKIDYNKLADFVFGNLENKDFESKIINLQIATFAQIAGCGFDRTDYSPLNLQVNRASEMFWNERNFKKFVNKFPDKIIGVYTRDDIQNKIKSYKNLFSKKEEDLTFYNAKNNFKGLNIKEIDFNKSFIVYIFISQENQLDIQINTNSYEPKKHYLLKYDKILSRYVQVK